MISKAAPFIRFRSEEGLKESKVEGAFSFLSFAPRSTSPRMVSFNAAFSFFN